MVKTNKLELKEILDNLKETHVFSDDFFSMSNEDIANLAVLSIGFVKPSLIVPLNQNYFKKRNLTDLLNIPEYVKMHKYPKKSMAMIVPYDHVFVNIKNSNAYPHFAKYKGGLADQDNPNRILYKEGLNKENTKKNLIELMWRPASHKLLKTASNNEKNDKPYLIMYFYDFRNLKLSDSFGKYADDLTRLELNFSDENKSYEFSVENKPYVRNKKSFDNSKVYLDNNKLNFEFDNFDLEIMLPGTSNDKLCVFNEFNGLLADERFFELISRRLGLPIIESKESMYDDNKRGKGIVRIISGYDKLKLLKFTFSNVNSHNAFFPHLSHHRVKVNINESNKDAKEIKEFLKLNLDDLESYLKKIDWHDFDRANFDRYGTLGDLKFDYNTLTEFYKKLYNITNFMNNVYIHCQIIKLLDNKC